MIVQFKVGDTVALKSGGHPMTLGMISEGAAGTEASCVWLDESGQAHDLRAKLQLLAPIIRKAVHLDEVTIRHIWVFADTGEPIADHIAYRINDAEQSLRGFIVFAYWDCLGNGGSIGGAAEIVGVYGTLEDALSRVPGPSIKEPTDINLIEIFDVSVRRVIKQFTVHRDCSGAPVHHRWVETDTAEIAQPKGLSEKATP